MKKSCIIALIGLWFVSGCTTHIAPYKPKKRRFNPGEYQARAASTNNSLYVEGALSWMEDSTASRIGDILVVVINEQESATRDATTQLARKSEAKYGVPTAFGLAAALKEQFPSVSPANLFSVSNDKAFDGSGKVARSGTLTATLPVRVRGIMPNGDLYIEGNKVVMVGPEEHHIYVSGLVRRADISATNTVLSSRIADAEIEYTGRGDVSTQQRQGWLSRFFGRVWPF